MVNIKMEFKHPKYYKELRKLRNNLDQAISGKNSTECKTRSPGPGLKQQAASLTRQRYNVIMSYKLKEKEL